MIIRVLTLLLALALTSPAYATDTGYFQRDDCGTLSPENNKTLCLQMTTASGRTAGQLYTYTGGSWVAIGASGSGGGHVVQDEGTPQTQREAMNFVGGGVAVTDVGGVTT